MRTFIQRCTSICLALLTFLILNGQTQNTRCLTDLKAQYKNGLAELLRAQLNMNHINVDDKVYTLPVVVHVIHAGSAIGTTNNPSYAAIVLMLDVLSSSFRKNESWYGGEDIKLQFQLATRSPDCGPTDGVNRIDASAVPDYATGGIGIGTVPGCAPELTIKNLSRWPNTEYINIWLVNKINGGDSYDGYAYYPQYSDPLLDGIVMRSYHTSFGIDILTHEMGHYFNLKHVFEDFGEQCTPDSCNYYGDGICDTEPTFAQFNCINTINYCTGNPYLIADAEHNYTVLNNYMNYSYCKLMFTAQQKERMRTALFAFRPGLINSGGLGGGTAISPLAACIPTAGFGLSYIYGVEKFEFNSINVYSNSSRVDGSHYIDRSCNQRTTVFKGQVINLTLTNSFSVTAWLRVYLDYNNDGDFDDAGEVLLSEYNSTSTVQVTIPSSGISTGVPLRLRAITDNQLGLQPTPCYLYGAEEDGTGQVEDFAVTIFNKDVVSLNNGDWNSPSTWTCNCIPQLDDQVTIKAGHTVNITPAMGLIQCAKIILEAGSNFNVSGTFRVNGNQ